MYRDVYDLLMGFLNLSLESGMGCFLADKGVAKVPISAFILVKYGC